MVARVIIAEDSVGLLTPRERECLRLVDQHLSSKQIARELGMSKTSVDTYCDRARRKLGVEDRYAAARLARKLDVNHVLTESGQDAIRTDAAVNLWPHGVATEDGAHGRLAELRQSSGDRQGAPPSPGDRRLRGPLADSGGPGGSPPDLHLGATGTTARRSGGDPGAGEHGAAPGVGHTQTGAFQ